MPNQFLSPEGDIENYFITEYWLIDQYIGDKLWTWGFGTFLQLGTNSTADKLTPVTTFAGGTNWKQVSLGDSHTAAIKTDGTLWTWGANTYGELGNAITLTRSTPVTTFAGGTNWQQVSAGNDCCAAIKTDGTLWTWGRPLAGQLGNGVTTGNRSTPVTTSAGGTNWKQVSLGQYFAGAIKTDGTLWMWGRANYGNLGNGITSATAVDRLTPITTFAGGTNWKQVSCSKQNASFTAAIKTDGTLWTWGRNNYGQLGNGETVTTSKSTPITTFAGGTNWKQVSVNQRQVTAIKTDGTLWAWGRNTTGYLGTNDTVNKSTPVTTFAGGTNWKRVSGSAAIKTDGTLWVWGSNDSGQLGINDTISRSTPVTTFSGETTWNVVNNARSAQIAAISSGINPDYPLT